jgi:hypothetical protein
MLVVEAAGDPNVVAASAFKLLFSTYFKLDGVSRIERPPAPRARWPRPQDTQGSVDRADALPPAGVGGDDLRSSRRSPANRDPSWAYGDVAEILHVGPYNAEQADIGRLLNFIHAQGYRVVGEHEEGVRQGAGMIRGQPGAVSRSFACAWGKPQVSIERHATGYLENTRS